MAAFAPGEHNRKAAQATFSRLKKRVAKGRWLGSNNRYRKNVIEILKKEKLHHDSQLAEYIAASAPLHCLDGWSYLGRSVYCDLVGDVSASRHLAYYSQVRAVMALLASEGIGVFKNEHYAIRAANSMSSSLSKPRNGNTHLFLREQFKSWASSRQSSDLFEMSIVPRGRTLGDWLNDISNQKLGWLAKDWLENWGYDLTRLEDDSDARNEASYRPSGLTIDLTYRNSLHLSNSLDLIASIWRMSEADGANGLQIDNYLLRRSWEKYASSQRKSLQTVEVRTTLSKMGIIDPELKQLVDFFMRAKSGPDPAVLEMASKQGNVRDADYHLQMIGRATLLLRLATGSIRTMIKTSTISRDELQFWWSGVGVNSGLWGADAADPLSDLWTDINEALECLTDKSDDVVDHYGLRNRVPKEVLTISGCEKIALSQLVL